nr:AraC family transcriptional regulator [Paenibacillus apiarius]
MTGFNSSYFSTLFRKQTGWGFSDYLNRMRVDKAKELLLTSDMTE